MPLLAGAISDNRQHWAEVARESSFRAGYPRPTVAELFSAIEKAILCPGSM
jgi:hypothetical protein